MNHRFLSWIVAAVVSACLALSSPPPCTAQDLCAGLVIDKASHPMTALANPGVGQTVTDPQFGTTIRRITAAPNGGVIKPIYSTVAAWNADESLLMLYRVGSGLQLYDGRTYAFMRALPIEGADIEQVYWDTADPDIIYYVDFKSFKAYHVSTNTSQTKTTFSFCSSEASAGSDPMYISWSPQRIGLACGNQRFVYDIDSNTVVGQKTMSGGVPQMAASGNLGFRDGDVVDASLNTVRTLALANPEEHASVGKGANGHDMYFGAAYDTRPGLCPEATLAVHDMTDATWRVIVGESTGYRYPPSGTHISAVALQRPGWVAVSIVGNPSGQNLLDNELLLANTAVGGPVCRIAHHRSYGDNGSQGYWAEPHAVISPSGTRVLFGSDWGNSGTVNTYVVELPGYGEPGPPSISIEDGSTPEGPPGAGNLTFDVTLSESN
jgi:hypothetical protein